MSPDTIFAQAIEIASPRERSLKLPVLFRRRFRRAAAWPRNGRRYGPAGPSGSGSLAACEPKHRPRRPVGHPLSRTRGREVSHRSPTQPGNSQLPGRTGLAAARNPRSKTGGTARSTSTYRRWDTFSTGEMFSEKIVNLVFSTKPWNTCLRKQPAGLKNVAFRTANARTHARTNRRTSVRSRPFPTK
jgi:hypothetical protein